MGKASRTKVDATRREKIAAQQAAARRAEQRRRLLIGSGSILVVLVIVVVFVVVKLTSSSKPGSDTTSNGPTGSALTAVINEVTNVPASTLTTVGAGSGVISTPQSITGSPLTANGKPEMLYIGAEYCPYCAAERWAMIVALSKFGTFTGLATVHSAKANGAGQNEPYPDTPTFTFAKATYTSQYLTFTSVEGFTNVPDPSNKGYYPLQTPTAAQNSLVAKYDVPPLVPSGDQGAIPFVDFDNKYAIGGAGYLPSTIDGLSWATIAADLSNPNNTVAKAIDGTANYITAAICGMTGNAPASACTATVQGLETKI
jgi:hypothetical protein